MQIRRLVDVCQTKRKVLQLLVTRFYCEESYFQLQLRRFESQNP